MENTAKKLKESFLFSKKVMSKKLDILSIDSEIRRRFEKEYKKLPQYKQRLSELEKTAECKELTSQCRNELDGNIENLKNTIQKIESKEELNFYIVETAECLQKYKNILKTPLKVSFIGRPKKKDSKKEEVIQEYLRRVQKYYPVELNVKVDDREQRICENCSKKVRIIVEENRHICPECGVQEEVMQFISSYNDNNRINISAKYTYDRKTHFRDCINQYQGKQNCTVDPKVYEDLERELETHHLLQGDKNTDKKTRFQNITRAHILMFLKELKYSKHYENVILIHSNMTGQKPDDISHLEDKLMNDFDLLVDTYDKHFKQNVDRVNFISTQYVLYQLLRKNKHPCKKEDFIILKQTERKTFHDNIYKELACMLGWNYDPLF